MAAAADGRLGGRSAHGDVDDLVFDHRQDGHRYGVQKHSRSFEE